MEILRIIHILFKNETDTKRNRAKKQCPVKKHLPTFINELNINVYIFHFSFHFNGSYTLSRIKYSIDVKSNHPGLKWPTTPRAKMLSAHAHLTSTANDVESSSRAAAPTKPPFKQQTASKAPSQTPQFQGFTYPQYLLWILAQQVDFQIVFPPVVTSYLVAEHHAREGVL